MRRPISSSLSPNLEKRDLFLALKLFFSPWAYFSCGGVKSLEAWFRNFFNVSFAISFNSGRSCLFAILKSLDIGRGDEVLIQAFTCVAVPNSIIWSGAKPVYVDIDLDLTINIADLERKITKKTKAIVVQHTFGIPAKIDKILEIAKKHRISVIEDCAHVLGETYKNKKLSTFGDVSFFSFGRDKAFSSVFGGMCIVKDKNLAKRIRKMQKNSENSSFFWTLQQIFHPIAFSFILPLYNFFSLGKLLLVILQKIKFLSLAVSKEEKLAKSRPFVRKMPNALSYLALEQLKRINFFNKKRTLISDFYIKEFGVSKLKIPYSESVSFLRFPLLVERRDDLIFNLKKKNIYIDKWYSNVIDPRGVDFEKIYYKKGSCPNAEVISQQIINLPTSPTMTKEDVQKIVYLVKKYV